MGVITVDCRVCSSRRWTAEEKDDSFKFECTDCGSPSIVHTGGRGMAYDCDMCGNKEWTLVEREDEHLKFRCDECSEHIVYGLER